MEFINDFIKPELLILVPVLYFIGMAVKKFANLDKYIPLIVGGCGVILALTYVCGGTMNFGFMAIFVGVTQGILCAGLSVYFNQILKQMTKGNK